ncbi:hypothetical protein WBP07_17985 [Novosphingobium sp. BL-8A]|uniref:hypothetical protein n=1 Tax=Novosphingobium sp. BL-8A TaxID=3127639 RepID=UPI00375843BB
MALEPTGDEINTLVGANRLGTDAAGNRVVVAATSESIDDFGWRTIWQAAESKYDLGDFEDNGTTRVVNVTTADCKAEEAEADGDFESEDED